MNLFQKIKEYVSVRQAAEYYGLKQYRNHMACCPFHDDRHPSLKLNERYYYCFGCGEHGDVIDFVAKLFGLSQYEAAKKLSQDFGIDPDPEGAPAAVSAERLRWHIIKNEQKELMECHKAVCEYLHLLKDWKVWYAPMTPDSEMDDRFIEACDMLSYLEYLADHLTFEEEQEQIRMMKQMKESGLLQRIKERLLEVETEDEIYDESAA